MRPLALALLFLARFEANFVGPPLPLSDPVLDLAFLGDSQVAALTTREVVLLRWTDQGLAPAGSRPLPGAEEVVRWPGGLLHVVEEDHAVWAIASTRDAAMLFTVQSGRLTEREQARALPFPGCRTGLRYRPGTNLLEGEVEGLGSGPFLALDAAAGAAVAADGRLLVVGATTTGVRVGPTLAALWPQYLAASTGLPPGKDDALLVFGRDGGAVREVWRVPMPGPVRALAGRLREGRARMVAAVTEGGESRLLALELSPLGP
ncbi:MAG TPA: hypothetical protein VF310_12435 [Vicinamibacteria bacterium]